MRLPYVPKDIEVQDETEAAILDRIKARRGSDGLLPLDLTLLHSFHVADGWNAFLGAIRSKTTLSPILREMLICRVAVLNEATFEWDHHAPLLTDAGFAPKSANLLKTQKSDPSLKDDSSSGFTAEHLAALAYTDAMTTSAKVNDAIFAALREHFDAREILEITATVAAYNCVSRLLVALDVDERAGH